MRLAVFDAIVRRCISTQQLLVTFTWCAESCRAAGPMDPLQLSEVQGIQVEAQGIQRKHLVWRHWCQPVVCEMVVAELGALRHEHDVAAVPCQQRPQLNSADSSQHC